MDKVEDLKKSKEGTDKELIQKNYDSLSEEIQKVGAKMYEQPAQTEAPAGATEADSEKVNEPIEGEFEEAKKEEEVK